MSKAKLAVTREEAVEIIKEGDFKTGDDNEL